MQFPALIGALLLLLAYSGQELGMLRREAPAYPVLNLTGSTLLLSRALSDGSYGFILLEGFWMLVSVLALVRIVTKH